uniref:Uncharacterized protein n=1 Tax=Hyaloperonospora arabidopsidis (strain Emoy2) TaxID=559515 RepID=M4B4U9_HYAAE
MVAISITFDTKVLKPALSGFNEGFLRRPVRRSEGHSYKGGCERGWCPKTCCRSLALRAAEEFCGFNFQAVLGKGGCRSCCKYFGTSAHDLPGEAALEVWILLSRVDDLSGPEDARGIDARPPFQRID